MTKGDIIQELVELILMQEKEIDALREKIQLMKRYLSVYEEYIQGEKYDGNYYKS